MVTEWNPSLSKHGGMKKHIVATPTFSALIVKDVSPSSVTSIGRGKTPLTVFFRDLRSVYAGNEILAQLLSHKPVFTLISRGVLTVFECSSQDEADQWVAALQVILHLVRHHDTKWIGLNG